jgi:hypothetical protein
MRHHLVVLHEHYLDLLLVGKKQIECRLSSARRPPFEAVARGDLLWLKLPSRPILGVASAGDCRFQRLGGRGDLAAVVQAHGDSICAVAGFFEEAAHWARFCSLIWIDTVVAIRPMTVHKSDMRAWVVLDQMPWPGMRVALQRGRPTARP